MPDYIIKVENLGKKYRIRHQQDGQRYVAIRDVIAEKTKGIDLRRQSTYDSQLMIPPSLGTEVSQ